MTKGTENLYTPNFTIHPGEYVEELLEVNNMTQLDLANRTGITAKTINRIIKGKASITKNIAFAFTNIFDHTPEYWMKLQNQYDLDTIRIEQQKEFQKEYIKIGAFLSKFDYDELVKHGYVYNTKEPIEQVSQLLKFFKCKTIELYDKNYDFNNMNIACRINGLTNIKYGNLSAWLRKGQIEAKDIELSEYNVKKFKAAIDQIRTKLTVQNPKNVKRDIESLFSDAGVAIVFVDYLKNSGVSGAAYWINNAKNPCIQLSSKYKRNDLLWFSLFHEVGHIIKHNKRQIFVESETRKLSSSKNDYESEADMYAEDMLIPRDKWIEFISDTSFTEERIYSFAKHINTHAGVIVGRLQKEKLIGYSMFNNLKEYADWVN